MTDNEIRDLLEKLDNDESVEVSKKEADFIENVVYHYKGPLSGPQKQWALDIIEKYKLRSDTLWRFC